MDRLMPSRTTVHLVFVFVLQFGTTLQQQQQSNSQQQAPLPIEWFALIHLRTSLGIRANEWPIKLNPCTDWKGVQCRNGSVVGINISGFRRTRFVKPNPKFDVPALQNLTRLELFNASFFALPGRIPDLFGQSLGKLQVLDLHSCSITGTIPFNFGNLTSLSTLILSVNDLTGEIPPSLGQLRNLSLLDLSQNSLTGSIPLTFSSLQNLSVLDISSNFLSGSIPPSLATISSLTRLNMSGNSLSSSIPPQFGDLASLVDLDLSLNSLRGSLSSEFRKLKSLQKMVIGHNRLSGALANDLFISLTQLGFVDLSWNNFSGVVPGALLSKPSLSFLDVSRNNLTGTLPKTVFSHHITTAVLNLSQNLYYGELTSVLQRFSSVDLSGNYFEGKVPGYARINSSLSLNCLQNVTKQRTLQDCSSFYHTRGLVFDNFGGTSATAPAPAPHPAKKSHRQTIILAAALGGAGILILLFLLLLLFLRNRRMGASHPRGNGVGPIPTAAAPPSPEVSINFASLGNAFTYQQLLQATGDFNDANFIKHGHSGDFYRGVLEGGTPVVIKKVDLVSVKKEAYLLELDFLSKVSHHRLVPLLGYCLEKENEKYLVYKYMPNGDLSSSLYRKVDTGDDSLQSLDWITRLKIAIGAAEGLSYLHHECVPPFVHRDVQASSILLDDKYEVRLGSLSEVCNQEGDGHQSVISRFLRLQQTSEAGPSGSQTTCAYDVYCFGKVLLELVTGKLGISASNDASVKAWLDQTLPCINIYDKELVTKIVDPSLIVDEDLLEEVWAMAVVARSCLNPKPSRRPLMRYILRALENPLKVVREESSARLRTTSSRGSWNAALFGSWRQSSDVAAGGPSYTTTRAEGGTGSFRRSGTSGSQGSDHNGGGGDHSSSQRRQTREIVPEPSGVRDIERRGED